jgi:hypothetical protein
MNHFFYEFSGKEKVRELVENGLRSQALHRSGALNARLFAGGLKLSLGFLIGLGFILILLVR